MALIATQAQTVSNVVKHEYEIPYAYCRKLVTVNDTAGTLAVGTVLGKVTSGGKFKRAVETASDGSKVGAAVVVEAITIAGSTDTQVLVLVRGPSGVSKAGLVFSSTYDDDTKKNVLYADIEALGIQILETV